MANCLRTSAAALVLCVAVVSAESAPTAGYDLCLLIGQSNMAGAERWMTRAKRRMEGAWRALEPGHSFACALRHGVLIPGKPWYEARMKRG